MSKPPRQVGEMCPEGRHKATCIYVVDLGTQKANNPNWNDARKLRIGFEIAGKQRKDGKPFHIFASYTFSANAKSNLAKDLKEWLSVKDLRNFDLADCLGKGAMLKVTHSEDGKFANVTSIMELPGKPAKPSVTPYSLFLDETFDEAVYNSLPDSFKEKIASSPEYDEVMGAPRKPKKRGK